ncbi:MAG: putative ABC transporter permease subunit [Acidobacteriota bacterium]
MVYAAFAAGAVVFTRFVTWYLLDYVRIGLFLYHRFIAMVLFVFFMTVSAGNIVVSFATLYRSPEIGFLLSSPVPYATIFTVKFLDNFFYSSGTLFLASAAVLIGCGSYFHLSWYFYPLYLFGVLVPCMLMAGSLAVIVLLIVMKLASKVRLRTLIAGVALLYAAQIVLYFTLTNPVALVRDVMQNFPAMNAYDGSLDPFAARFLPNYWAAQTLYFWITDFTPGVGSNIALCVLTSAACFIGAVLLGGTMFYGTWLTSISLRGVSSAQAPGAPPFFHFARPSRLPSHVEAVLKKEYWIFFRDPGQWVHASVMAALLLIFLASVATMEFRAAAANLRAVTFIIIFMFNAFLISSIALRFAFPSISLEGKAYWTVRSAPMTAARLYWIKFLSMAAILAVLGVLIWLGSIVPYRHMPLIPGSSLAVILGIAAAAASLNFGMGSVYADFSEKNPIRIASSQGATMTFLFTMMLLGAVVALYFSPALAAFIAQSSGAASDRPAMMKATMLILLLCLAVAGVTHRAGLRALKNDF